MLDLPLAFALPYFITGGMRVAIVALREPKPHDEEYGKPTPTSKEGYKKSTRTMDFLFWVAAIMFWWPVMAAVFLKEAIFPDVPFGHKPPRWAQRIDLAKDGLTDLCVFAALMFGALYFDI